MGRDAQGLTPRKKDGPGGDEDAASKAYAQYMKMVFAMIPTIQLVLAVGTFFALRLVGFGEKLDAKFAFLTQYDLGYVYLAIYIISMGRNRVMVNANVARAGARVDRPDQHVYKVMDAKAPADAPLVLMANTGWPGKFNRAQRGAFNTDESLPQFLVNTLLSGAVFGPAVVPIALLQVYGRVTFALKYTESKSKRGAGFLPAVVGENWMMGLVLFVALKAIGGSLLGAVQPPTSGLDQAALAAAVSGAAKLTSAPAATTGLADEAPIGEAPSTGTE